MIDNVSNYKFMGNMIITNTHYCVGAFYWKLPWFHGWRYWKIWLGKKGVKGCKKFGEVHHQVAQGFGDVEDAWDLKLTKFSSTHFIMMFLVLQPFMKVHKTFK